MKISTYPIYLQYFKPSGKWGYEGILEWPKNSSMHGLMDHVDQLNKDKELPGLASGTWEGHIYIDTRHHPMGFPMMIVGKVK